MSQPSYVGRRAMILAEFFLEDLKPIAVAQASLGANAAYDYLIAFNKGQRSINVCVEVKGTENPLREMMTFHAGPRLVSQIKDSNLPTLILIVDVRTTSYAWNWGREVKVIPDPTVNGNALLRVPLIKKNDETFKRLRAEIMEL